MTRPQNNIAFKLSWSSRWYRGGEGELPVVQGGVGRAPGGTGVGGGESSRWYRVWLGEFPVVQG